MAVPHFWEYQWHGQHVPVLEKVLMFGINRRRPTEYSSLKIFSQICDQCSSPIFCFWLFFCCCYCLLVSFGCFSFLLTEAIKFSSQTESTSSSCRLQFVHWWCGYQYNEKKNQTLKHGNWSDRNNNISSVNTVLKWLSENLKYSQFPLSRVYPQYHLPRCLIPGQYQQTIFPQKAV